jgi:hypothetical protein
MTSVEEEQVNTNSQVFILPSNTLVKSQNLDSDQEEFIEEKYTCGNCPDFLNTYCQYRGIAVSPRYHCNKTKKSLKK